MTNVALHMNTLLVVHVSVIIMRRTFLLVVIPLRNNYVTYFFLAGG